MKMFIILLLLICSGCATTGAGYIAQNDKFSCGPVAVYNAMVAKKATPPDLDVLRTEMHTSKTGTTIDNFIAATERLNLKLKQIAPEEITLNGTYIVAMAFKLDDEGDIGGHFVFMKDGEVYNLFKNEVQHKLNYFVLQGMMWKDPYEVFPIVWEVK